MDQLRGPARRARGQVALLEDGEDIDYDGVSGPIELSDKGDPTSAIVGIYTYGPDNKLTADVQYQPGELE